MNTTITNPIGLRALEKALQAARARPKPRKKYDSRTADKFVLRGYTELFAELSGVGKYNGRSTNSEIVAGVLESLTGFLRAKTLLRILKSNLGEDVSQRILAEVPTFDLHECKSLDKFVIRFPPEVRNTIRDDVRSAASREVTGNSHSMNQWILKALVEWVKIQRQYYALLSATIAHERVMLGFENDAPNSAFGAKRKGA